MLSKSIAAITLTAVVVLGGLLWSHQDSRASSPALGSVVGIEKHSNPYGDRWITILPMQPAFGIWVTEACALSLHLGDDWPSSNAACQ